MIILENIYMKVIRKQYKNSTIKKKKIWEVNILIAFYKVVFCSNKVTWKYYTDILVKSVKINNCCHIKQRRDKNCYSDGGHKLFMGKNKLEVVRLTHGIASIHFFKIDVLLSNKSIWFNTEIT